jgi:group I intron endonuclease
MKCGVYKIISPTNKIYVGSSKDIYKRWKTYKSLNCKSQKKLYASFLKYGVKNHKFEIIQECLFNELFGWENLWGNELDCCGKNGLNLCLPGFFDLKSVISQETRQKMSIVQKNRKVSKETIEKRKLKLKGRIISLDHRKKLSESYPNKKIILNLFTGIFFNSAKEAAKAHNINQGVFYSALERKYKKYSNFVVL